MGRRWFCRLGLGGSVADRSTLSKARHGRFRDAEVVWRVFDAAAGRAVGEASGDGSPERLVGKPAPAQSLWLSLSLVLVLTNPASAWTSKGSLKVFLACGTNRLVDLRRAVVHEVRALRAGARARAPARAHP